MTAFRTVLVAPPVLHGAGWWSNRDAGKPHLESLAAQLSDLCGCDVLELDRGPSLTDALATLDEALSGDVGLIGVSCWTSLHYLGAVAVIEHLRATRPELPIVVGGHHATALPSDFDGLADWVVVGDGEHALRGLCAERPLRTESTHHIRGRPVDAAAPDLIDWTRYGEADTGGTIWLALSRGCPFRCRFCLEPLRGAPGSRVPVDRALAIIEEVVRHRSPRSIAFADPLFGSNRAWTEALLQGLEERELPVQFWAETRADLVTPDLLARYRRTGFKVDFGLDTGSVAMAEIMEKAANPAKYLARSAEMLRQASIEDLPHGVYLLFNYPGETPETAAQTRAWIRELMPPGGASSGWLSAQTFFTLPGTESHRRAAEYAERFGAAVANPTWWRQAGDHHALATDTLPHRDWIGRESELREFARWQRGVNARWSARWTPAVRGFVSEFYGTPT